MPGPPFPLPDPDAPPDPDGDDPDPRPSAAHEYSIKFTASPDANERLADFVEWLLKIDPNDSTLCKSAKLAPKDGE
jgi:hypothetical protein